ncbi:hypothetical protein [Longimicrobium sp.]|jgi:hypothetical protein|uniref:hypothetical protein n=1 Tax=Longimicrobium sp. TaxID=2029185 RepID=UPI002F920C56
MRWQLSWRADPVGRDLADRHYTRQKIGAPQFVPPGRCLVLTSEKRGKGRNRRALWVTSWPFGRFVKHAWAGAWMCSCFRNEGAGLSSALIREAVAATRWRWPDVPELGMVTFVDESQVKPRATPGLCFIEAGFQVENERSKGGLLALRLRPEDMPDAVEPMPAGLRVRVRAPRPAALFPCADRRAA